MGYTIVLPHSVKPFTDVFMVALCIYREARGEDMAAKIAVGCVIRNRVLHPSWYGKDWCEVITKKWQFSSFNLGEPNSIVFGGPYDTAWRDSIDASVRVMQGEADPTGGATFYFDRSLDSKPPKWAAQYAHTADIGAFHFYKPKS